MKPTTHAIIDSTVSQYLNDNVNELGARVAAGHIIGQLSAARKMRQPVQGVKNTKAVMGVSFDLVKQEAADYAKKHGEQLIQDGGSTINGEFRPWLQDQDETLRSSIAKVIQDGIDQGKSRSEVEADLEGVWNTSDTQIGHVVAWEIPNAQYHGSMDRYGDAGIELYDWLLGDEACPICQDIAANGPYTADTLPSDLPHNSCRCDISPRVT